MFENEAPEPESRPKLTHLSYSYFSVEVPFDEAITKRIRADHDPYFIPVAKFEVYKWPDGGEKRFVHWGFGFQHDPALPVADPDIYSAMKPFNGYFSKLPRAGGVAVWCQGPPFAPKLPADGTPGITVPFDERAYAHAKDCKEEMNRRAERAKKRHGHGDTEGNSLTGVNDEIRQTAYKAVLAHYGDHRAAGKAAKDEAFEEVRYVLRQDKRHHQSFLDLTDADRQMMAQLYAQGGDRKNAVHFALPSTPAKPGGIILAPR